MGRSPLRTLRRRLTAGLTHTACDAAPWMPKSAISAAEWLIGRFGALTPVLASTVRRNMKAAGVYSPKVIRDYFRNAALHLTNGVRIFHFRGRPEAIREIARREVDLDPSVDVARKFASEGPGGIITPAHCTNYLVSLVRLRETVPFAIYLRWSKDQRKVELKRKWCENAGLDVIIESRDAANPMGAAMVLAETIRDGKILAITPDLAQESDVGTPVQTLGRTAYLPTGPASLALLCDVPLIPLFARQVAGRQILYAEEPIHVRSLPRTEGGRSESVRRAMQAWADGFDRFIRTTPEAWFLWGDNRWTRVFQDDPEYTAPPADGDTNKNRPNEAAGTTAPQPPLNSTP